MKSKTKVIHTLNKIMSTAILIHCLLYNIIINYSKTIRVISSYSSSLLSQMNFIEVKRIFRF